MLTGGTLLLLPEVRGARGGIQRFGWDLVQAVFRADPRRRVVALVLKDPAPASDAGPHAHPEIRGYRGRRTAFAASAIGVAARQRPSHVILGHRHFLCLAPLLSVASRGATQALFLYGVEAAPRLRAMERLALRWVDALLAVSPQTAAAFQAAGTSRSVGVWPCSLPASWDVPEPVPSSFEPPHRLLSVARLLATDGYKGVDHTILALGLLPPGEAVLDVVGDGDDRPRLERLVAETGLADAVRFHGAVGDDELRSLYAACDVFVLPSGGEGFGIVYLEAMAFAKPVIAAREGGAPFAVRDGETGWLVPYGQPSELARRLRALFARPEQARRIGLAGRRQVEGRFSFEAMVERASGLLGTGSPGDP